MTSKSTADKVQQILYMTKDPTMLLDGRPIPAMTTLLHRVCDNDLKKFEETCRIVELFIAEALADA